MANISLKAVSPGRAELHIAPWNGAADGVELSIQRNDGSPYLDPQQRKWVGEQQWMRLQGARRHDDTLVMPVGAEFVDPLLAGTQGPRCVAYLRVAGGDAARHPFRIEPDVLPSTAAGDAPSLGRSTPISPVPAAEPEPVEPPPPVKAGKRRTLPIALAALALLLAAGVAAYLLLSRNTQTPSEAPKAADPAPAAATAPACSTDSLDGANAMDFVQACVRDIEDSAALLAVIRAARDTGKCEIAQRLYANRANAGDTAIAMAYAQEYDPASDGQHACFKADAATARYWYESVLEQDPQHAEARARLQALPQ